MDANVFRTARENLPGHWMKGDFTDNQGNFCVLGHIAVALGEQNGNFDEMPDEITKPYHTVLSDIIDEQYHAFGRYPVDFNDGEETTEDDVVMVLDRAIAYCEEIV